MSSPPSACERLAQSRERLRQALQQVSTGATEASGAGADTFLGGLLGSLQAMSGDNMLADVLATWWRKQPLRVGYLVACETTNILVQPYARRHPYRLVLGAAVAGGLLALVRPWRWFSVPALMASLLPHIMANSIQPLPLKPGKPAP